jgi:hypothetical protein
MADSQATDTSHANSNHADADADLTAQPGEQGNDTDQTNAAVDLGTISTDGDSKEATQRDTFDSNGTQVESNGDCFYHHLIFDHCVCSQGQDHSFYFEMHCLCAFIF